MTIDQLIQHLKDYRDQFGGDAEVRLMTQESWPFENAIAGVTSGEEINGFLDTDAQDVEHDAIVYIVEGEQVCYGSKRAWDACRGG